MEEMFSPPEIMTSLLRSRSSGWKAPPSMLLSNYTFSSAFAFSNLGAGWPYSLGVTLARATSTGSLVHFGPLIARVSVVLADDRTASPVEVAFARVG
jgi:hypothetical protein